MKHYERLKRRAEHGTWFVDMFLRYGMTKDAVEAAKIVDEWVQKASERYWRVKDEEAQ